MTTPDPAPARSLTRPRDVRALLAELDVRPSRMMGQNFLIDANILRILTEAAEPKAGDRILEIGPGLGVLTEVLLAGGAHVTAIEKDRRLHAWLQRRLGDHPRFTLHLGDATQSDLPGLFRSGIGKLVSNLPYSVGSRILMDAFQSPARPARMVVTVQREVADRIAARPDTKDYGLLSVWAQTGYAVRYHKTIPGSCFMPAPEVASSIVVMERLPAPRVPEDRLRLFATLVRNGFQQRRKQLGRLLGQPDRFAAAGLDPAARAEHLTPDDWARLCAAWVPDSPAGD